MRSKISIAVSAVLAVSALGAAQDSRAAAVVADAAHFFPTSGSTAMNNPINEFFLLNGGPCAGSTTDATKITVYTDGTFKPAAPGSFSGFHQVLVACPAVQAFGTVTAGQTIALAKEGNGGSLEGTYPVSRAAALPFLDALGAAGITCTNAAGGGSGAQNVSGVVNAHEWAFTVNTGCSTLASVVPTIGWADELPSLWLGFGLRPISNSDISSLNTTAMVQNAFGIAVSLNAYRALQNMQGKVVNDDTLANMPTLDAQTIAGLYTGTITSWNSIVNAAGAGVATFAPAGTHAPKGPSVFMCRRGDSSGTAASADQFFLGNRCNANGIAKLAPSTANTTLACKNLPTNGQPVDYGCAWQASNLADQTFAAAGGGDVASCLDAHNANDDYAFGELTTNQLFASPNDIGGSTGTLTTGTNVHFRFVAIDGALPNLTSIANGQYTYIEDNVLNDLKTANANVAAMYTFITTKFQNANILLDIYGLQGSAQTLAHVADPDWNEGLLFDPVTGPNAAPVPHVTTAQLDVATAMTSVLTQAAGAGVNNCQPPLPDGGAVNP